jgi:dTDP-4-dehydrorhamnose 3,5-epimerase
MQVISEPMPGVLLLQQRVFSDDRGSFVETFNRSVMAGFGVDVEFVQDNQSTSVRAGTVRGLHLQLPPHAQGKLVRVLAGSILDVAVDVRPSSPTFGQHCSVQLSAERPEVFWVPPGFAHGFATLEPDTVVAYKCTELYAPEADRSIRFDDPALGIDWPVASDAAVLSDKDAAAPLLADLVDDLSAAGW